MAWGERKSIAFLQWEKAQPAAPLSTAQRAGFPREIIGFLRWGKEGYALALSQRSRPLEHFKQSCSQAKGVHEARPYNKLVSVVGACLVRARSAEFIAATVLLKMP